MTVPNSEQADRGIGQSRNASDGSSTQPTADALKEKSAEAPSRETGLRKLELGEL